VHHSIVARGEEEERIREGEFSSWLRVNEKDTRWFVTRLCKFNLVVLCVSSPHFSHEATQTVPTQDHKSVRGLLGHTNIVSHKMPFPQTLPILRGGRIDKLSRVHPRFCSLPNFLCSLHTPKKTQALDTPWPIAAIIPAVFLWYLSRDDYYGYGCADKSTSVVSSMVMVVALYRAITCMVPHSD
jgi:hypothetical protein